MKIIFQKFEKVIFYLLIFAIPFETRIILKQWTPLFNEWTSAFLYFTDILIVAILVLWVIRCLGNKNEGSFVLGIKKRISNSKFGIFSFSSFWLILFFIISALSILNSKIIGLSFYQLIKLAEFIALFFYLRANIGKIFEFKKVLEIMIISGAFQAAIGIIQYFKQGNLGLRILGESPVSVDGSGVAIFIANGEKFMRAYGTTPHPNVLAAWLFVALFAFYNYYLYTDSKDFSRKNIFFLILHAIVLSGLFFTFSRTIIALWLLGSGIRLAVVVFKKRFFNSPAVAVRRTGVIFLISAAVILIFSLSFWPQVKARVLISSDEEAVTQRVFFNKIAGSMTEKAPILGVGVGQFVPDLMDQLKYYPRNIYQPVHNIYLLISSEVGLFGLASFIIFLLLVFGQFIKKTKLNKTYYFSFFVFSVSFLAMGFFDHFLWTLQQGSLILWTSLALLTVDM